MTPRIGSAWSHHVNGHVYIVKGLPLVRSCGEWVKGIRYQRAGQEGADDEEYVRALEDFFRRFSEVT